MSAAKSSWLAGQSAICADNAPILTQPQTDSATLSTSIQVKRRKRQIGVPPPPSYGRLGADEIVVGFDCEWKLVGEGHNKILSYQFFAVTGSGGTWSGMLEDRQDHRCGFGAFLSWVILDGLNDRRITRWPKKV